MNERATDTIINLINAVSDLTPERRAEQLMQGGLPSADVLLLKHGDFDGAKAALAEKQILYVEVAPERLPSVDMLEDGRIPLLGQAFGAIVVPSAAEMTLSLRVLLDELAYAGILVFFTNGEPTALDENGLEFEAMGPVIIANEPDVGDLLRTFGCARFTPTRHYRRLRVNGVQKEALTVARFENLSDRTMGFSFEPESNYTAIYDPTSNRVLRPQYRDGALRMQIKPHAVLFTIADVDLDALAPFPYGK